MLLSVKSTQSHPVLAEIVQAHPECFEEDTCDDWEQLTLALRLLYEMTLGKKSYWYPYLRLLPDVTFTAKWDEHELEMTQDAGIAIEIKDYSEALEEEWIKFSKVLKKYPDIFP